VAVGTVSGFDSDERQARIEPGGGIPPDRSIRLARCSGQPFQPSPRSAGPPHPINPRWRHLARIKASDLLLLDVEDAGVMQHPYAPDPTAWCIHGALHRSRPEIRCVLHTHMPYATTLTSLDDSGVLLIDQNSARFCGRISYDGHYGGFALKTDEGQRIAQALGDRPILFLKNLGVIVTGRSVAEAFDELYCLETACRQLVIAYSTGKPLRLISDNLAARVAGEWAEYAGFADAHFAELKALLDAEDAGYAT
jgi:ribulose-5-phosphate 4-epimerase/fuculose-1-phosphate aldolase